MADKLLDKDGNPTIAYNKDNYNPTTQENEPDFTGIGEGNVYDPLTGADPSTTIRTEGDVDFSIAEGAYDERYDQWTSGAKTFREIEENRLALQSNATKAFSTVPRILVGAAGTALKMLGYSSQRGSYQQFDNGADFSESMDKYLEMHDEDNIQQLNNSRTVRLGNWLEEASESWLPVYEAPGDDTVKDQLLKWGTLKGGMQSTLGFLASGMVSAQALKAPLAVVSGAGRLMNYISKISRAPKVARAADRLTRATQHGKMVANRFPKANKVFSTLGATYIQTTGEAVWEAADAHDEVLASLATGIATGKVDGMEALAIANETAETTYRLNMLKGALNLTMMSKFTGGKIGAGIKKPGVWEGIKRNAYEAPQEAIEEASQNIGRQEATNRAIKSYAKMVGDSPLLQELESSGKYEKGNNDSFFKRFGEMATSNEVIVDAIVGGLSGGIGQPASSFLLRNKMNPIKGLRKIRENYEDYKDREAADVAGVTDTEGVKAATAVYAEKAIDEEKAAEEAKKAQAAASPQATGPQSAPVEVPPVETTETQNPNTPEGLDRIKFSYIKKAREARKAKAKEKADARAELRKKNRKNSEGDIRTHVEKAALVARLVEITKDNPELAEVAKEQVYLSMINESIANGTFPAFLAEAKKTRDTNEFTSDLYGYALKAEKKYKRANRYLNVPEVVAQMNQIEGIKSSLEIYRRKEAEAVAEMTLNKEPEQVELDYLSSLREEIDTGEKALAEAKGGLKQLTSYWTQRKLLIEADEMNSVAKVIVKLDSIQDKTLLAFYAGKYPELKQTVQYKAKRDELAKKDSETVTPKEPSTNPETPETPGTPPTGNPTNDRITDGQIEDRLDALFLDDPLNEEDKVKTKDIAKKLIDNISVALSEEEYNQFVDRALGEAAASMERIRYKRSEEGKQTAQAVKREVYRNKSGEETSSDQHLDVLTAIMAEEQAQVARTEAIADELDTMAQLPEADPAKQKALEDELLSINNKLATELKDKRDAAKGTFTKSATKESLVNKTDENPTTTNTKGLNWSDISGDFKLFFEYMEDIKGKDYVRDNYALIRRMFMGYTKNKGKGVPATYTEFIRDTDYNKGDTLDASGIQKARRARVESLTKLSSSQEEGPTRKSYNQNPADSIAHLTQSHDTAENLEGKKVIFTESNPVTNVSPLLDPNNYNGGEGLDYDMDWDYDGDILIEKANGETALVNWKDLQNKLFNTPPVKGQPLDFNPNAIEDVNKAWGTSITSAYDVLPLVISGKNKDGVSEKVGYVHNPAWINETTADEDKIESFREKLKNTRAAVVRAILKGKAAKGTVTGKVFYFDPITGLYRGAHIAYGKRFVKASGVVTDNLPMGVVMNGRISTTDDTIAEEDVLNYEDVFNGGHKGLPVIYVPLGKKNGVMKYHAEIIYNNKLSEGLKHTAKEVIKAFMTGDKLSAVAQFYAKYKYDITKVEHANKVLAAFMQVYDEKVTGFPFAAYVHDSQGVSAKINLTETADGVRILEFGSNSTRALDSTNALMGTDYNRYAAKLNAMFDSDMFVFKANNLYLEVSGKPKAKKNNIPPVPSVDENDKITEFQGNYRTFIKDNSDTLLQPLPKEDGSGNVYTVQNIVEFAVDGGRANRSAFDIEGISIGTKPVNILAAAKKEAAEATTSKEIDALIQKYNGDTRFTEAEYDDLMGHFEGMLIFLEDQEQDQVIAEMGRDIKALEDLASTYESLPEVRVRKLMVKNSLSKEAITEETGLSTFGPKGDIPSEYVASKGGITVDQMAHNIWQEIGQELGLDTEAIKNMVIDGIQLKSSEFKENILETDRLKALKAEYAELVKKETAPPKKKVPPKKEDTDDSIAVGDSKLVDIIANMDMTEYITPEAVPSDISLAIGISVEDASIVKSILENVANEEDYRIFETILEASHFFKKSNGVSTIPGYTELSTKAQKLVADVYKSNKNMSVSILGTIISQANGNSSKVENIMSTLMEHVERVNFNNLKRNCN